MLAFTLFAPGFFSSGPVLTALTVGGLSALVSAAAGVFAVTRGQSFAGHSFSDIGAAGGAGAVLVPANPLAGFLVFNLAAAGLMQLGGSRSPRSRDVATGLVLGAFLGLAGLFLYLDTTIAGTANASQTVLFGSIFVFQQSLTGPVVAIGIVSLLAIAVIWRPLLLTCIGTELAAARGVRVGVVGLIYLFVLGLAVSLASLTVGAILATGLLIGPPAAALRLTSRPGLALAIAAAIGVGATWLGVLIAYDSYDWFPSQQSLPVSFTVVAAIVVAWIVALASGQLRELGNQQLQPPPA